jgi:hypothetical protein
MTGRSEIEKMLLRQEIELTMLKIVLYCGSGRAPSTLL